MYSSSGKAIITMPVKVVRQIEKARQTRLLKIKKFSQIYGVDRRTAPLIISCRDPKMNHYLGQRYPMNGLLLATENWKKPKQDGDHFVILPRPSLIDREQERSTDPDSSETNKTESICHLQPYLRHRFLRLTRNFLPEALLTHVKKDVSEKKRTAVFVQSPKLCYWLENFLSESGIAVIGLRENINEEKRSEARQRIVDGDFSVMVSTDAGSTDLKTDHLQHVINYQLPETIGGYLKRAAILGKTGLVTTFVTNVWEINFVEELEKSVRLNEPLSVDDVVKDRPDYEE